MYTMNMNLKILSSKLKEFQNIDDSAITTLYTLSSRSLLVLIALAALTTVALYPVLQSSIIIWFLSLVILTGYRLYSAYTFKQDPEKYSMSVWYKKFILTAVITALIFSALGFIFIHQVDYYYQLYILAVLVGLSSGSIVSLSPDIRVYIAYATILLFPLTTTLLFLDNTPLHIILAISLILYFIAQVTTIYKINTQKNEFNILQSEHMLLDSLFKNAPLGVFAYNKDLEVVECNEQFQTLFNHDREQIIGMNLNNLLDSRVLGSLQNALTQGPQFYKGHYTSLKGEEFWIDAKAFSFTDTTNRIVGGVGMIEDKTREQTALTELEYMAQHDVLTGLLNRRGFKNNIEDLVNDTKHKTFFSILFYLDLNQFKSINDSLGHAVGDDVLLAVSKRLLELLDKDCIVSRLGGDEFIIISPYTSEDNTMANKVAREFSQQIQNIFREPFIIQEMHLHIKSSIGIVLIEPGYTNTEEIIRHADLSMYQAKISNNHVSYYDSSLDKQQKEIFHLQHDLAYAIEKNQFDLYYQPVVDSVCQHVAQWKKENQWKLEYVSINVNAQQFIENNFVIEFLRKLEEYGLDTNDIMIEITERSLIDNFDNTQYVINDLRSKGVKCAIDDFGIGYSSLSYLKKLSFHTLKIDRAFIKDIEFNPKELHLVSTILDIGRQFNYNIVIEGIEDRNQKELLLGLDNKLRYQGYHFSKPLHAKEFRQKFLK